MLCRQSRGGALDHGGRRVGEVGVRRRVRPRAARRSHHLFREFTLLAPALLRTVDATTRYSKIV